MPYQTNANILVAIKRESTFGVAPSAGSATRIRLNGSGGLELKRSPIQSQEKRADALNTMGRLGGKSVEGSYNCEFAVGGETDILIEAIMRASYVAAVAITQATMTSITTTATTIVAAAGSWITQGVRVGDIVVLTGHSTAANNNINLRVTAVSTLTLTLAGTAPLVLDATPDTTFTLTIQKKVINGDAPIRFSHTIEQYDQDTDLSELFLGCRLVGMKLSCKPNGMVMVVYTFMGVDRTALTTGTSPFYTTPALSTGLKLIADDSAIRYNGADVVKFNGLDLDFKITAKGEPVLGSFVSPDIFDNDLDLSGSITSLRSDFSNLTLYDGETEFELSLMLQEPTGTPKPVIGLFLPRVKIAALSAPVGGDDGAKVETLGLMIGPKALATGYDATLASWCTSAP